MDTIKLLDNESLIDSFDLNICIVDPKCNELLEKKQWSNYFWETMASTSWYQVKLYFTSNRIEFQSSNEKISIAYKDVKNIGITNLRVRPKGTLGYTLLGSLVGLGFMILGASVSDALSVLCWIIGGAGLLFAMYCLIFRWVMTDHFSLGEQVEFSILKDNDTIDKIKDAYEKGKHYIS
jgi:hypothetical protein